MGDESQKQDELALKVDELTLVTDYMALAPEEADAIVEPPVTSTSLPRLSLKSSENGVQGVEAPASLLEELRKLDKVDGLGPMPTRRANAYSEAEALVVPRVNYAYSQERSIDEELGMWFNTLSDASTLVHTFVNMHCPSCDELSRLVSACTLRSKSKLKGLLYYALGGPYDSTVTDGSSVMQRIRTNTGRLIELRLIDEIEFSDDDPLVMTLLFTCIVVGGQPVGAALQKKNLLQKLFDSIVSFRWKSRNGMFNLYLLLLRVTLGVVFGKEAELETVEQYLKRISNTACGGDAKCASYPWEYYDFCTYISSRYPSYRPPKLEQNDLSDISGMQYTKLLQKDYPEIFMHPKTPVSIMEACELLRSRVKPSVTLEQYSSELRFTNGTAKEYSDGKNAGAPKPLLRLNQFLDASFKRLKSFLAVLVAHITEFHGPIDASVHAAVTIIDALLKWSRLSHVLMFEYVACLLFDFHFLEGFAVFCSTHPPLRAITQFNSTTDKFSSWIDSTLGFAPAEEELSVKPSVQLSRTALSDNGPLLHLYSRQALDVYIVLTDICKLMVEEKPIRIVAMSEVSLHALKQMLAIYNQDLWVNTLALIKFQVPFTTKKWRCSNMDIISAIYMYSDMKLYDSWLSAPETYDAEIATKKEENLRRLIEIYNRRRFGSALS